MKTLQSSDVSPLTSIGLETKSGSFLLLFFYFARLLKTKQS